MTQALRPLTIGELLDRSFSLYRRHFATLVGIAAISGLLGPAFFLSGVALGLVTSSAVWTLVAIPAGAAIYLLSAAFTQGAITLAVSKIQLGEETSASEAMRAILPRVGTLALTILNSGIRTFIGFLLLIVPGVILLAKYALAVPVAVLEERAGSAALRRSGDLTNGYYGRILLIYVLLLLLTIIGSFLWEIPSYALIFLLSGLEGPPNAAIVVVLTQIGPYLTGALLTPIVHVAFALTYFDQRVRKEAFDLQHMMQQIDGATASGEPR